MSTTASQSRIVIESHSSRSRVCRRLITALDVEVESLYPDYADFPYEGAGNWLKLDVSVNPVPVRDVVGEDHHDGGCGSVEVSQDQWQNGVSDEVKGVEEEDDEDEELFFFVAWSKAIKEEDLDGPAVSVRETNGSDEDDEDTAIGCVGLRLLPQFPFHRAPPSSTPNSTSTATEPLTAELKRMYVVPSHRGRRKTTLDNGDGEESVASMLLCRAETFAREQMKVKRLVLETGCRQVRAMGLYQRLEWRKRTEFGDYVGAGEDVGGLSRCWEKWL